MAYNTNIDLTYCPILPIDIRHNKRENFLVKDSIVLVN